MPIATVKELCTPNALVNSDSLVEQVAQIEDFAGGRIDGGEFFRCKGGGLGRSRPSVSRHISN
jgi:hypothetical protein